ncbi:methyltransferase [Streptomyces caeruleatus]|uniref:Methyltransferase n=1 Tax=Streptomyces caeruleatus TaxID=661399 RepID=A0A101TNR6_9ACTN|nr:methyltransferase [Streptomyces caeruleatus]KUN95694.1 methyltransferase [Streptomyces caeruleatus]
MHVSHEDDPVLERFHFLVNAPALFNAVATAVDLDIFGFLSRQGPAGFQEIHEQVDVPAHQLRVLLQGVCATGLLTRDEGRYANSAVAEDLLASDAEDSWSHILLGWRDIYYPAFGHMTMALRAGTNTALADHPGDEPTLYQRLSRNPELEAVFHRAMSAFTLRSVDALVARQEFSSVRHLLDIGGGDGTTSARLSDRYPDMRITVFDIPSVSRLAEDKTTARFGGQVALCPGDIFVDPFPQGADGVLFSHVLEIFSEDVILGQLKKAYDALPSGGRVFVYGYNVSDDETDGIFSARLGLYFNVLASGQGMAYPAKDYEAWLSRVGFTDVRTATGLPYEHGLSMGVKP